MISLTALRLAQVGITSVTLDLAGTCDSEADFRDVDWHIWVDDVATTYEWAAANDCRVTGLLAIRLGAALANSACTARGHISVHDTVLWNPVFDGKRHLSQFLRLKTASNLSAADAPSMNARKVLAEAGELEVAGYVINNQLAVQLEQLSADNPISQSLGRLTWLEVVRDAEAPMPGQSVSMIQRHIATGRTVLESRIPGQPFYAAVEITEVPDLIEQTVRTFVEAQVDGR